MWRVGEEIQRRGEGTKPGMSEGARPYLYHTAGPVG